MLTTTSFTDLASETEGRILTPTDADWDDVRQVFNLTTDLSPAAIALPRNVDDVVSAVGFARANGFRVAPQATGHNAAPLAGLDDLLLVDVRELDGYSIDADARRVRVGAGVRWQQVIPELSELGLAALHGSSPLVGIAGYSLGGGMGWLARKHGLQANSVTAVELVTAEGRVARVDSEHEPELFWALRGGNGNFGVVTAIEFEVYPAADLYAGAMFFPFEDAREVIGAWTEIESTLPEEAMTWVQLMQFPDLPDVPTEVRGQAFTVVLGAFLGEETEGARLLEPIRALGPAVDSFAMVAPIELAELAMDPPEPLPIISSTALIEDLPVDLIDELLAAVGPGSGSPLPLVQIRQMGGALAEPAPGAGARAILPGRLCVFGLGVPADEASAALVGSTLAAMDRALESVTVGAYPNFVEKRAQTSSFFDEATWARLRRAKALYDPADLFRGNHHIPPETTLTTTDVG